MKTRFVLILILAAALLPAASALTYYAGDGYGWQRANSWNYQPYNFLQSPPRYGYDRPSGYGLTVERGPAYPPVRWHNGNYCENPNFLGHTSAWQPGVYRSGSTGYVRPQPHNRPRFRNCPPTHGVNNNVYRNPYW